MGFWRQWFWGISKSVNSRKCSSYIELCYAFKCLQVIFIFLPNLYFLWDLPLNVQFFQSWRFSGRYLRWVLRWACPDLLSGKDDSCLSCYKCSLEDIPTCRPLWRLTSLDTAPQARPPAHPRVAPSLQWETTLKDTPTSGLQRLPLRLHHNPVSHFAQSRSVHIHATGVDPAALPNKSPSANLYLRVGFLGNTACNK